MTLFKFTSLIFGGLVENEFGQYQTSNELIEVKSRRVQFVAEIKKIKKHQQVLN